MKQNNDFNYNDLYVRYKQLLILYIISFVVSMTAFVKINSSFNVLRNYSNLSNIKITILDTIINQHFIHHHENIIILIFLIFMVFISSTLSITTYLKLKEFNKQW